MSTVSYLPRRLRAAGLMGLLLVAILGLTPGTTSAQPSTGSGPEAAVEALAPPDPDNPAVMAQWAYRQGREAQENGKAALARRKFEEAARLDQAFGDPLFALAASYLPFRPDAAFTSFWDGVSAETRTFRGQHRLAMNLALLLMAILAAAILAASALIGLRALAHFQHPIFELIHKRLPTGAAALAAWVIVIQPALWGLGLYLTLTLAIGLLWKYLSRGEKRIAVALVALSIVIPAGFHGLSKLASPLNPESNAYFLSAASETPDIPGLEKSLAKVIAADPTDPSPHMALGLVAEHKKNWKTAENEYRRAIELQGSIGRLYNNLGNILVQTGRVDQAVDDYKKAIEAEPLLAAPHFNLSQAYARRLQFDLVDVEMARATELDFEGMRTAITQNVEGQRPLISLGLAPEELWQSTFDSAILFDIGLPRMVAWVYDGSLRILPFAGALLFAVGLLLGRRIHRFLPTYACANCSTVVCRKCLRRIRRRAYCAQCGDTILSLKTSEFTRMLLDKRLKEDGWLKRVGWFFLLLLIPGWEAIRRGRPLVGLGLMTGFMSLVVPVAMKGMPVKALPSLVDVPGNAIWIYLAAGLLALYGASAAILKALPEPESALMGQDLGMMPGQKGDSMDKAA